MYPVQDIFVYHSYDLSHIVQRTNAPHYVCPPTYPDQTTRPSNDQHSTYAACYKRTHTCIYRGRLFMKTFLHFSPNRSYLTSFTPPLLLLRPT